MVSVLSYVSRGEEGCRLDYDGWGRWDIGGGCI